MDSLNNKVNKTIRIEDQNMDHYRISHDMMSFIGRPDGNNIEGGEVLAATKGEHRLLWAMLERAISDAVPTYDLEKHFIVGARIWIKSRPVSKGRCRAWSFDWVCEHLGLEPERVRRIIEKEIKAGTMTVVTSKRPAWIVDNLIA